jgi:hypothetical protein
MYRTFLLTLLHFKCNAAHGKFGNECARVNTKHILLNSSKGTGGRVENQIDLEVFCKYCLMARNVCMSAFTNAGRCTAVQASFFPLRVPTTCNTSLGKILKHHNEESHYCVLRFQPHASNI